MDFPSWYVCVRVLPLVIQSWSYIASFSEDFLCDTQWVWICKAAFWLLSFFVTLLGTEDSVIYSYKTNCRDVKRKLLICSEIISLWDGGWFYSVFVGYKFETSNSSKQGSGSKCISPHEALYKFQVHKRLNFRDSCALPGTTLMEISCTQVSNTVVWGSDLPHPRQQVCDPVIFLKTLNRVHHGASPHPK